MKEFTTSLEGATVRKHLDNIEPYLDLWEISEDYLQMPGYIIHDKLAGGAFSPQELEQLRGALLDLSEKLRNVAQNLG